VFMPHRLGGLLLLTPALEHLRACWPNERIIRDFVAADGKTRRRSPGPGSRPEQNGGEQGCIIVVHQAWSASGPSERHVRRANDDPERPSVPRASRDSRPAARATCDGDSNRECRIESTRSGFVARCHMSSRPKPQASLVPARKFRTIRLTLARTSSRCIRPMTAGTCSRTPSGGKANPGQ